jgi:histidine kinase
VTNLPGFERGDELVRNDSAVVARAVRRRDDLPVLIKYSAKEYPPLTEAARFRNEFDLLQRLQSPHVIRALGLERLRNRMLLVQEDFGGLPLSCCLSTSGVSIPTFLEIAVAVADGLVAIHAAGIIHKNISPDNILFNAQTNEVKITDLGISTRLSRESQGLRSAEVLEGTLAYISPEQTGRVNRAVDFRTDLYSLGATFYHLLAGVPPFESTDALELVHSHIAKNPRPLRSINPEIPAVISDIVAKLMSKSLEYRYQSAVGLRHDLQQCQTQWKDHGRVDPMPLSGRDASSVFEIPQRIFGRESEIEVLLGAFDRVIDGVAAELLLVGGYSGVGKSALVREVHKPITARRGYFIAGKYDQFDRGIPYSALAQAFDQMVQIMLTEPPAQVEAWSASIKEAMGSNGRLLLDLVPSLESLVGPQPAVPVLTPTEAQSRFNLIVQNFVQVLAQPEHPLVLFLDDLQWADNPSLAFLEGLLCHVGISHLFVICAYRDNEVTASHPFMLTVHEIAKSRTNVGTITLSPLTASDVGSLVSETLQSSVEQTVPLTRLLYDKTGGNPFFLIQLLHSLHEDHLLTLDMNSGRWLWDIAKIRDASITDNIVDLMTLRIRRLPDTCKDILKLAACMGSKFDLKMLSTVSQTPYHVTADNIWPALSEGLIVPISANYQAAHELGPNATSQTHSDEALRAILTEELREEIDAGNFNAHYRFLHDRVQQAAYLLIPEQERQAAHLRIGRLLLAGCATEDQRTEVLFEMTQHFNIGLALITDEDEWLTLAKLNLEAGRRAKAAAAHQAAVEHFTIALELVGSDAWERHYDILFELHTSLAECHYLIGNFAESDRLTMEAVLRGKSKLDKVAAYATRVQLFMTGSDFASAVQAGIEALTLLGFTVPRSEDAKSRACSTELAAINERLSGIDVATLIDLPAMADPEKKAALDLLVPTWCAAYFAADMKLSALVVYWMVGTSLEYGNTDASAMGYVLHGMLLAINEGNYRRGFDFGMLAKRLNEERFPNPIYTLKVCNMIANSLNPYFNHLETNLQYYMKSYTTGPQVGDIFYSLWAAYLMILVRTMKGDPLADVLTESDKYQNFVWDINDENIINAYELHRHLLLSFQGLTESPGSLNTSTFNEAAHVRHFEKSNFHVGTLWYGVFKTGLLVHMGQFPEALRAAEITETVIPYDIGLWSTTNHYFYQSLAVIKMYPSAAGTERAGYDELLARNLNKFKLWSENGPANFLHRYQLMLAEKARLDGRGAEAETLYDLSIENAASGRFTHDEALALELAAYFYLAKQRRRIAQVYLTDAYYAYVRWGAAGKTKLLERDFADLLLTAAGSSGAATVRTPAQQTLLPEADAGNNRLDFSTLAKATQTLSREIVQDKLLAKLMSILMENAGADRGVLILEKQGKLFVEAEASTRQSAPIRRPLEEFPELIHGVVNLVFRTRETLVLDDAALDQRFASDEHVVREKSKSVLCLPILNQGKLHGLVYFENKLSSNVFTRDRLAVLELLLSQAAISIENSRLYEELEARVQARTGELREAQAELVATARRAGMAEIATNVLHNVGNVLNSVNVAATLVGENIRKSKVSGLGKAVGLMREHALDLGTYLSSDPSGRRLPDYLAGLSTQLAAEQEVNLSELAFLRQNIDHIKEIVATQQAYAGYSSIEEVADIRELANDSLRMNLGALSRHGVEVVRDFADVPPVTIDKHKILQILVNLVSNAKHACDASERADKQLIVRVRASHGRVSVSVVDNGVGIPAKNLTSIFNHGFTTKKDGHGFGLHACALAAKQMRGTLRAESYGPGQGATFTLEFPAEPKATAA